MNDQDRKQILERIEATEAELARMKATAQQAQPSRRSRFGWMAIAALAAGAGYAGVPSQLTSLLLGVGSPEPGEFVPRQIPYRGYLERDGVPLSTPQSFGFRLEYGDGGTAWNEPSINLRVSNGHFEVALGDNPTNKIPPAVFSDPLVLLSVSVGGAPLVGKQRLLTVPYAAKALDSWRALDATRAVDAVNAANAVSATSALRAEVSDRLVLTLNGKSTSIGGKFCGLTPATTGAVSFGPLVGYRAMKALCEQSCGVPTAHVCSSEEAVISHTLEMTVPSGWVSSPAESVDYRMGPRFFRDCLGFTSSAPTELAQAWGTNSVGGSPCGASAPIVCCD